MFDNIPLSPDLVVTDPPPLEEQPAFIEAYGRFKAVVDSYQRAIDAPGLAETLRIAPELVRRCCCCGGAAKRLIARAMLG